jgi:5'-nucleotidase
MIDRRKFITLTAVTSTYSLLGAQSLEWLTQSDEVTQLTILHTNDVHSRIDSIEGGKYDSMGGVAPRFDLIQKIRKEQENVLLLDCGDIFQGTPYFNLYKGEVEIKAMTEMGYDVATLGNHDFDLGIDGFMKQYPLADFKFVNCNYNFRDSDMEGKILPYTIIHKGPLKIGVLGVGIELKGLVPPQLFGSIKYNDPIANANKTAALLKYDKDCDLVICLSHLGYHYDDKKVCDKTLASMSENIDIILGGHTHTFLEQPVEITNKNNVTVLVNQVGWGGIVLGRLDIFFNKEKTRKNVKNNAIKILKKNS